MTGWYASSSAAHCGQNALIANWLTNWLELTEMSRRAAAWVRQCFALDRYSIAGSREVAMNPCPIRVALVIDHPPQQFARALQLLAREPGVRLDVYYWSVAERFYDPGFERSVSWDIDLLGGYPWGAPPADRSVPSRLC